MRRTILAVATVAVVLAVLMPSVAAQAHAPDWDSCHDELCVAKG